MERNEQPHEEVEETLDQINKKTGRNMPQAIATAVVLIAIILACLLISVDLFVYLVVLFMVLALWELRVDFATAGLHIPVVALWACSAVTLLATYYSKHHIVAMTVCVLASLLLVAIAASAKVTFGSRLSLAVADKLSHTDAGARLESSFNHEQGEVRPQPTEPCGSLHVHRSVHSAACLLPDHAVDVQRSSGGTCHHACLHARAE